MSDWGPTASEDSFSISSASEPETNCRKRKNKSVIKCDDETPKTRNRNFCESWLTRFKPWLISNPDNPLVPFCKACSRVLQCRRHSIERHSRAAVHQKHFSAYCLSNGLEAPNYVAKVKLPRKPKKKLKQISLQAEGNGSTFETVFLKEENAFETRRDSSNFRTNPQNRKNLMLQIQKDQNELMQLTAAISSERKKSPLESFFDSLTTTVSAFPPRLAVETKLRVSQLICELEMRAISANESSQAPSTVLVSAPADISYAFDYQGQEKFDDQVGSSQRDPTCKEAS